MAIVPAAGRRIVCKFKTSRPIKAAVPCRSEPLVRSVWLEAGQVSGTFKATFEAKFAELVEYARKQPGPA